MSLSFDDDGSLVITGQAAGTVQITATATEALEVSRLPDPTRSFDTLTVTVT